MICPDCAGDGYSISRRANYFGIQSISCNRCSGTGEVLRLPVEWKRIGAIHRAWREAEKEGLALCAERMQIDPRHLNDMEHGTKDSWPLVKRIPAHMREAIRVDNPRTEAAE